MSGESNVYNFQMTSQLLYTPSSVEDAYGIMNAVARDIDAMTIDIDPTDTDPLGPITVTAAPLIADVASTLSVGEPLAATYHVEVTAPSKLRDRLYGLVLVIDQLHSLAAGGEGSNLADYLNEPADPENPEYTLLYLGDVIGANTIFVSTVEE